ncbi:acetyl-CoA carboxylase biotin carboxyl carrier protein [Psychrobacter aestuarii]|uniref:Biotin carboxyl carrier protein of acetyl-CoA carboxylase n=1 Tax=Psychrobacter aestuarii TaxID=556327 RepID=A0ABN0VR49_9GAMM|nr:acetyl-CoA carboxylase biotin carboxyl carrier protein [Psychrobacter aestuarii]
MNIDFNHLEQLIKIAENADIHALEVTDGAMRINIICQPNPNLGNASVAPSSSAAAAKSASTDTTSTPDTLDDNDNENAAPSEPNAADAPANEVPAPMLGTFYRRSNPDAEAFVEVGAAVEAGQTLCIIEAMKMMHEVKADYAGKVTDILVDDGDIVEYGQPLLVIEPSA